MPRLCERIAHVRAGGWPSEASVKFFAVRPQDVLAFFSKKLRPCPYKRAAQERKLGKQGLCPAFPGRQRLALSVTAAAVPAPPEGEPSRCATKSLQKAKSCLPLWGALVPSGDCSGPTEPAGETLAAARAHREDSARARGLHPRHFAPRGPGPQWGPFRTDRAGRRDARCRSCSSRGQRLALPHPFQTEKRTSKLVWVSFLFGAKKIVPFHFSSGRRCAIVSL